MRQSGIGCVSYGDLTPQLLPLSYIGMYCWVGYIMTESAGDVGMVLPACGLYAQSAFLVSP